MTSYKTPSLFELTTASNFFQEFIELNRQRRGFSQRSLAQKLKWPVSYIPDLIKGRKVFSIQRATQLGRYLKLDPMSFEKLVLLSIQDMGLLGTEEIDNLNAVKSSKLKKPTTDLEMLDAKMMLVFESVRWLNGKATQEALVELLETRNVTSSQVAKALQVLSNKGHIKKIKNGYEAHPNPVFSDDGPETDTSVLHTQFSELQQAFFKKQFGPATYNSAYVHMDTARFNEVADKLIALRNWILEVSVMDEKKYDDENIRLFQLDLNLTPIFSKQQATKWRAK